MTAPLQELRAHLSDLDADLTFVALATRLRPRIGDVVRWDVPGEVTELARTFMSAKTSRPEGVYGPLLVRLFGAVERYIRRVLEHALNQLASHLKDYAQFPKTISHRNIRLTGRALATIDEPRDHMIFDVQTLIDNLASCKPGLPFRLNNEAFAAEVTGASPAVFEKALGLVDLNDWWDAIGQHPPLVKVLGTKGARMTGDRAKERLRELWRWRNHLAHGGDEEPAISELQLRQAMDFLDAFTTGIDHLVLQQLRKASTG